MKIGDKNVFVFKLYEQPAGLMFVNEFICVFDNNFNIHSLCSCQNICFVHYHQVIDLHFTQDNCSFHCPFWWGALLPTQAHACVVAWHKLSFAFAIWGVVLDRLHHQFLMLVWPNQLAPLVCVFARHQPCMHNVALDSGTQTEPVRK